MCGTAARARWNGASTPIATIRSHTAGFFETGENDEACIVHQGVESAEAGNRKFDDTPAGDGIFQILVARGSRAADCRNLRDDGARNRRIKAAAVLCHPCIVDNDRATESSKESCIGSTQASPCAGYDDDVAVETDRWLGGVFGHGGGLPR